MKKGMVATTALVLAFGGWITAMRGQQAPSHRLVTEAEYDGWQRELSNWGRWGKDDEWGTLNLITSSKRKTGGRARQGRVHGLARGERQSPKGSR